MSSRDQDESSIFSDSEIERDDKIARKQAIRAYYGEEALDGNSSSFGEDEDADIVDLLLAQPKNQPISKKYEVHKQTGIGGKVDFDRQNPADHNTAGSNDGIETGKMGSFGDEEMPDNQLRVKPDALDGWDHYEAFSDDEEEKEDKVNTLSPVSLSDDLVMGKIGGRYTSEDELERVEAISDWYQEELSEVVNCYGVVHVRLLKGRKLPCPVRSSVLAVIRLLPWKGCVRLEKVISSYADGTVVTDWSSQETAPLVHAYSDGCELPSLQVELFMITPLFLEFKMATLTISCAKLLADPGKRFRQWLKTDKDPELQVEAWFESPDAEQDEGIDMPLSRNTSEIYFEDISALADEMEASSQQHKSSTVSVENEKEGATIATNNPTKKFHLFHNILYRSMPAVCCVCGKSIFWIKAQQCEVCKLDCCSDCLLSVDARFPCGNETANDAVRGAIQSRWTVDRLLDVVAPHTRENLVVAPALALGSTDSGIGIMRLEIGKVFALMESLPPETDPREILLLQQQLRPGDYYVRIGNQRTRTIQQSKGLLNFENHACDFVVSHYGEEFKVELIEANSDSVVGTGLLSTQVILQQQRDLMVEQRPFLSFFRPLYYDEMRSITVELRYFGGRLNNSLDFFDPPKKTQVVADAARPGDIVGCIEARICMEENYSNIFSARPYDVPERPDEELDLSVFQHHLSRVAALFEFLREVAEAYGYLVGWKDPLVTGAAAIFFIRMCIYFDPAYIGALPFRLLIILLLLMAIRRSFGKLKNAHVRKEVERNLKVCRSLRVPQILMHRQKAQNEAFIFDTFRPVGSVDVKVLKGRNLKSFELGLPGNVGCRISWDPARFLDSKHRKMKEFDLCAVTMQDLGETSFQYTANPVWSTLHQSEVVKRLQRVMPSNTEVFSSQDVLAAAEKERLVFPVLQPLGKDNDVFYLEPWESPGPALVFDVQFSDFLNLLPGSEYSLGEVVIPMSEVLKQQNIVGWFDVVRDSHIEPHPVLKDQPQIYLEISWFPPENGSGLSEETLLEASNAIQEELFRSAILVKQRNDRLGLLGSSMGAFNTMRGISTNLQMVQNTLGKALCLVESLIHLFDFAVRMRSSNICSLKICKDPFKSLMVLLALCLPWLVLSAIPTKLVVLIIGLIQFGASFHARFFRSVKSLNQDSGVRQPTSESTMPFDKWVMNALRGVPTSEDLRRTYFWEARREGARGAAAEEAQRRSRRFKRLWRVQWHGNVKMLTASQKGGLPIEVRSVFLVVQGHQVIWWRAATDFDNGGVPLGRILMAGHAGLSGPSPIELRAVENDEVACLLSFFGNGARVTILMRSEKEKDELALVITTALDSKKD